MAMMYMSKTFLFSRGTVGRSVVTPFSPTNKAGGIDITEILLKVALNTTRHILT
jgi:hypothetical protein